LSVCKAGNVKDKMQRLERSEIIKVFKDAKMSRKWLEENQDRESAHARRCLNIIENCIWLVADNPSRFFTYGVGRLDRIGEGL